MNSISKESIGPENPNLDPEKFAKQSFQKSIENILIHAPAMICILRGPEHIFEIANQQYLQLIGFRHVVGKTVREVLPEVQNQGFFEILDNVYETGKAYVGSEVPIKINLAEDGTKLSYLDFVYQPTFEAGKVDGIFVHAVDVTTQVLARKRIENSEKKLNDLIDTVPSIIWITDKEGKGSYLNKYWYDFTGQSRKEADGFGWLNAVHPQDRPAVERHVKNSHSRQKPYNLTFRLGNKFGDYRWVIDKGMPKYGTDNNFEGMVGTVVDVHEEKMQEQLIREKEHRIRSIVEEATVATAVYTGENMTIELANDAMIQLWGKDRTAIGKTLREALPELEGQPFHDLLQEVFTTGNTYWGKEDRVDLMINGQMRTGYFNFTYKPLRNEAGEIYGILNMAVDVTEMVQARNLLKESESHFRQMTDLMPDKIINTDADGSIIYLNQNWLTFTGLTSDEIKVKGWAEFIHPDDRKEYDAKWKSSLETGAYFEMELRFQDKNGKYKWHLSRAEAVKGEGGKIKMWIGTNTEIQKIKEEEKRKEDFLKMVSHELKTPVTSIKGYVQLLLTMLKKGQDLEITNIPLAPSLERIDHQIGRLTRLISEMLDLTRIEDNKLELKWEIFNLNELVNETVQDINYTNTQHKIKISHNHKCEVKGDKDRIGQVIINLITNAIKYSPESQDIEIKIYEPEKGKVAVSVKDFGIGIAKKDQKNIFKRFYRINKKSDETYAGFGIGLFLANDVIQRHKGEITVNSNEGEGSEFIFALSTASNCE